MHWKGGEGTPPPPWGPAYAQLRLPDGKCQLQWHLCQTVTAPNRFGSPLQPPI